MTALRILQDAILSCPDGLAMPATVMVHWHTSGPSPRSEGPIQTMMTVQKFRGVAVGLDFSLKGVPEFDPREHIEASTSPTGEVKVMLHSGAVCAIEPIQINGVVINAPDTAARPKPIESPAVQGEGLGSDQMTVDVAWVSAVLYMLREVEHHCIEHFESRYAFRSHLEAIAEASAPRIPSRHSMKPRAI